jgi:lysophospholipase L1-like esterase
MKTHPIIAALAVLLLTSSIKAVEPASFPFRDGDRPVVFIGDSITEQRLYPNYIESYLLTRFPAWKMNCRNVGWSGDTMPLRQRGTFENGLSRDILSLKPAIALINFGMNDARAGEANIPSYTNYAMKLVTALTNAGARVVLLTPSPEERYVPNQPGGSAYNILLRKYGQALSTVSDQLNVPLVNQLDPFIACIEAGRQAGVLGMTNAPCLIPDGVHPNPAGHFVMAATILKGLKAPALVSRLDIDGVKATVITAEGCSAKVEKSEEGGVNFTREDACLPWPIADECKIALLLPGFTPLQDLDQYLLAVKGLPAGSYELKSENGVVGAWTSDQLAAGVNLATNPCPAVKQALDLQAQVAAKNNFFFERWRNVQVFNVPAWITNNVPADMLQKARQIETERLDTEIAKAEARIDLLRQPKPQAFTLRPAVK